jgi:hypothetical protein
MIEGAAQMTYVFRIEHLGFECFLYSRILAGHSRYPL